MLPIFCFVIMAMRIADIFQSNIVPPPDFAPHLRHINPPLDHSQLHLGRKIVGIDEIEVPVDPDVVGVLALSYKAKAGGILSLAEDDDGETWRISQVQGARSRKSYRMASGISWERVLAADVLACANIKDAVVKRITMAPLFKITNICDAASQSIESRYLQVRSTLGMRWSEEEGLYVRD